MLRKLQARLTFSNTISLIALFVALGGTSYAAVALPRNSVGHQQIKTNAVRAAEINRDAVGAAELKNGSLTPAEFAPGVQLRGETGPAGPAGPEGPAGPAGPAGPNWQATVQFEQATAALADNSSASYDVHCPAGQQAIGGGSRGDMTDSEYTITTSSRPIISLTTPGGPADGGTFTGWRVTVFNPSGAPAGQPATPPDGAILPQVWVICAPAPAP